MQWPCWKLHDIWMAYVKIWSRHSLHRFCGRAQTYWNQSDVFDSQKLWYVMLTFETKIHRLEWFAQVILLGFKIWGLVSRRDSVEAGPKYPETLKEKVKQHSSHLQKIGACLRHQPLNQRKENLLWTPERRCIWSAKKDLNDAEMDTLTKSCSPTIVITPNGEVQTHEEATVYVKELDIFLTMKVLEDTPLGKPCDEHGYSYEWINGQKPHLIKNCIWIQCNTENFVPILVYQRVLPQACLLQHLWHLQGRQLIIPRLTQARVPHQPWLCQATVRLEHGETCVG